MNSKTYYWQLVSHDEFTFEEAAEITKRKNPGHEVQGFKVLYSKMVEGYFVTTWISRLITPEDL